MKLHIFGWLMAIIMSPVILLGFVAKIFTDYFIAGAELWDCASEAIGKYLEK